MVRCKSVVRVVVTVGSLGWASVLCFILLPAPSPGTLWPATMKSCHSAETGWWRLRSPGAATTWWTPPSGSQVCVLHLQHVRRKCVKVNSSAATQPEHEALSFSAATLNRITVWTEAWSGSVFLPPVVLLLVPLPQIRLMQRAYSIILYLSSVSLFYSAAGLLHWAEHTCENLIVTWKPWSHRVKQLVVLISTHVVLLTGLVEMMLVLNHLKWRWRKHVSVGEQTLTWYRSSTLWISARSLLFYLDVYHSPSSPSLSPPSAASFSFTVESFHS